jgi:hypothetical protein
MTKRIKLFALLSIFSITMFTSCDVVKKLVLGDSDIAGGLKEALIKGVLNNRDNAKNGSLFSGTNILEGILPEAAVKAIKTLETLGLSSEITRFTNTLTAAATKSAEKSVPIFLDGIKGMNIKDAISILGGGYNAATNYLRTNIGDTLNNAIKPQIAGVLSEYKLPQTLGDIAGKNIPVIGSQKLNLDFNSIIAKMVANKMFKEIEATEYKIRTDIKERTSTLLQQVFSDSRAFKQ